MMGKKHGFDDIRGNVFFHIIDIINEKKPTFILLENVKNIIKHDKGNTIKIIIESIKKAGYPNVYLDVFNTENFGLAQKRNRVYIFASSKELPTSFKFNEQSVVDNFKAICSTTSLLKQKSVLDVLQLNADKKYYLSETLKPTILANGSKNFKSKSEINQLIARPLTATMVKLHRACQDNYYSDDFLFSKDPKAYLTQEFSKEDQAKHNIRRITPNEAFALQGFDSSFYKKALDSGLSHFQLYKQAGNAVSVNTVYAILHYLFVTNKLDKYVF
jgi:DNA (cytosine-5)-methyltransferase 1